MILVYFPDKRIHQFFLGFGTVTTVNGTLHINGMDTTTCAADVLWKYIADQQLEQNETGFVHGADYYEELTPQPTQEERLAAVEQYLLEQELGL